VPSIEKGSRNGQGCQLIANIILNRAQRKEKFFFKETSSMTELGILKSWYLQIQTSFLALQDKAIGSAVVVDKLEFP
jgi:hypothetical protein